MASSDTTGANGPALGMSDEDTKTLNKLNQYYNGTKKQ